MNKKPRLTDGELEFMRVLWILGEGVPEEIQKALAEKGRDVTGGTIRNILVTMVEKGYVTRKKSGKAYIYSAKVGEEETKHFLLTDLLEKVFGGSESQMVAALIKNRKVNENELEKIKKLIKEEKKGD